MLHGEKVTLRTLEKTDMQRLHEFANDYELHLLADDEEFVPRSRRTGREDVRGPRQEP